MAKRQLVGHKAGKHRVHVGVKATTINVGNLSDAQRGKGRRFTVSELRLYTSIKRLNHRGGGAKKRQPTDR